MDFQFKKIAVKVGSNVLTRTDGTLDVTRVSALVDQLAELRKAGVEVVLISSGAVASGRSELKVSRKLDSVDQRQLFSAIGQAKLINRYYELFREHGITVPIVAGVMPVTNGKQIQRITTNEPDDGMIEVAIRSLELVLPSEKGKDEW